jgi:hypothetical protein
VSIDQTHIVGDLTLNTGALQIELSSSSFDNLLVDGLATLGGTLNVVPLGFTPVNGDHWPIIAAGALAGQFSSVTSGYTVQQQGSNLVLYFGSAPSSALGASVPEPAGMVLALMGMGFAGTARIRGRRR